MAVAWRSINSSPKIVVFDLNQKAISQVIQNVFEASSNNQDAILEVALEEDSYNDTMYAMN